VLLSVDNNICHITSLSSLKSSSQYFSIPSTSPNLHNELAIFSHSTQATVAAKSISQVCIAAIVGFNTAVKNLPSLKNCLHTSAKLSYTHTLSHHNIVASSQAHSLYFLYAHTHSNGAFNRRINHTVSNELK
jgi:hypothetical protein